MHPELQQWVAEATGLRVDRARQGFGGGSRELWFVDASDGRGRASQLVVRRSAGAPLTGTPFSTPREAAVYRALEGTGVPAPRLLASTDDDHTLLLERVPGDARVPEDADALLDSFMHALGSLHELDPVALGLHGNGWSAQAAEPESWAHADLAAWGAIADTRLHTPEPMIEYARGWLADHAPRRGGHASLLQGDTGPGNFLHADGEVTGLVDFEFAHLGDPMDDIAWIDLRCSGMPGSFGDATRRDAAYREATGRPVDRDAVAFYAVMVRLRCAITTGVTIAAGGGALGLVNYLGPHHRFLVELGRGIAQAAGLEPAGGELELARDVAPHPADMPANARLLDEAIAGLEAEVLPALAEPGPKLRARGAAKLLRHQRAVELHGSALSEAEQQDRSAVLGRAVDDAALAPLAADAGRAGDLEVLGLLVRSASRAAYLWETHS